MGVFWDLVMGLVEGHSLSHSDLSWAAQELGQARAATKAVLCVLTASRSAECRGDSGQVSEPPASVFSSVHWG